MRFLKGKRWLAMMMAFLLCLSSAAFGSGKAEEAAASEETWQEAVLQPEDELNEEDIVEAVQIPETPPVDEPEITPNPGEMENPQVFGTVQPVVLDVEQDPVATDVPLYTPLPSLECNPGFEMGLRSEVWADLRLDPGGLRIPSNGMPIPLLYQYDYRKTVCSLYGATKSVASSGCGAAAASMLIAYVRRNYDQTPYTLFYWAVDQGWYHGDGLHYEAIRKMLSNYGVGSHLAKVSKDGIISALKGNQPVVIKMGPGTFTNNGHYIVLRGLDESGWVLVNDPNSSSRSADSYSVGQIVRECKSEYMLIAHARPEDAAVRKKEKPAEPKAEMPATQDSRVQESYSVRVKRDSVNLRKAPVDGEVVTSVKQGTVLNVTGEVMAEGQVWCLVDYQGETLHIRGDMISVLN